MGIVKEKIPFCTHDLSESGHRVREDAALHPRLVRIRAQREKRCHFVPMTYPDQGTEPEKILFCTHGVSESGHRVRKDTFLYPRLVLMWVQRRKIYRSVPIILVSEGTTPE